MTSIVSTNGVFQWQALLPVLSRWASNKTLPMDLAILLFVRL